MFRLVWLHGAPMLAGLPPDRQNRWPERLAPVHLALLQVPPNGEDWSRTQAFANEVTAACAAGDLDQEPDDFVFNPISDGLNLEGVAAKDETLRFLGPVTKRLPAVAATEFVRWLMLGGREPTPFVLAWVGGTIPLGPNEPLEQPDPASDNSEFERSFAQFVEQGGLQQQRDRVVAMTPMTLTEHAIQRCELHRIDAELAALTTGNEGGEGVCDRLMATASTPGCESRPAHMCPPPGLTYWKRELFAHIAEMDKKHPASVTALEAIAYLKALGDPRLTPKSKDRRDVLQWQNNAGDPKTVTAKTVGNALPAARNWAAGPTRLMRPG